MLFNHAMEWALTKALQWQKSAPGLALQWVLLLVPVVTTMQRC
jgi:hypothetical protein